MTNIKSEIFDVNGLRCIYVPIKNSGLIFSCITINRGAYSEEGKFPDGVAHFLEHLICKGTKSYPTPKEIYEQIDSLGCQRNGLTSSINTQYYNLVLKEHWDIGLKYTLEQFYSPVLPESFFDNEKKVILEEARRGYTDQTKLAYLNRISTIYPVERSKSLILGSFESIEKIQYRDLIAFFEEYYTNGNSLFFVCGDISKEQIINQIKENQTIKSQNNSSEIKIPRANIDGSVNRFGNFGRKNSSIGISYEIPIVGEKDFEEAWYVGSLLSMPHGPGHQKLRHELGLTYSIACEIGEGVMSFILETDNQNENQAIEAFESILDDLAKNGIKKIDFERIKAKRKFDNLIRESNLASFGLFFSSIFSRRENLKSIDEYYKVTFDPTIESTHKFLIKMKIKKPTIVITT